MNQADFSILRDLTIIASLVTASGVYSRQIIEYLKTNKIIDGPIAIPSASLLVNAVLAFLWIYTAGYLIGWFTVAAVAQYVIATIFQESKKNQAIEEKKADVAQLGVMVPVSPQNDDDSALPEAKAPVVEVNISGTPSSPEVQ